MLTLTSLYAYVLLYLVGVEVNLEDQSFSTPIMEEIDY